MERGEWRRTVSQGRDAQPGTPNRIERLYGIHRPHCIAIASPYTILGSYSRASFVEPPLGVVPDFEPEFRGGHDLK